jgi:DNA-binding response OmpR family regulator
MSDEDTEPFSKGTHKAVKTIFIVEDDPDIGSFLVQTLLLETSYHPIWVTDGLAALKIVHGLKPDLLILDYRLPRINGIELYDYLRTIKELAEIPAILITAGIGMPRRRVEKRHMVGLRKPLELSEFLVTIEKLLASS